MTRRVVAFVFALILAAPIATAVAAGGEAPHPPDVNWIDFGYGDKAIDGSVLEGDKEPMAPPFVAVIFNFAIFAGLLVWKGGPPIMRYLRGRHDQVKSALEEAARIKAEASAKLAEYKAKLAAVDGEVDELVAGMRADAEAERRRLIEAAEAQAASLKKNAEDRIAAAIGRARSAIEAEVVAAAVAAAEATLREKMKKKDHNELVTSFIASFEAPPPPPEAPPRGRRDSSDIDEGWS